MTNFASGTFKYIPPRSGDGANLWYAPFASAPPPAIAPIASGANSLAAGNNASATGISGVAFGTNATATTGVAIGNGATSTGANIALGPGSATGENAIAAGNAVATARWAIAMGDGAVANEDGICIGRASFAGDTAVSIGLGSSAPLGSSVALGNAARTYNLGELARCSAVTGHVLSPILGVITADAVPTSIFNFPFNGIAFPPNNAITITGQICAYRQGGAGTIGDCAGWKFEGLARNVGGVTTIVSMTVGVAGAPNFNDPGAATWFVQCVVSPQGRLDFQVTGQAGETISWTLSADMTTANF